MLDAVVSSIKSYTRLSEKEISNFTDRLQEKYVQKGSYLLEKGAICRFFAFLNSGSFKQYHKDNELNEVIVNLYTQSHWVFDHQSFTGQKPAENWIEAYEDSSVLVISMDDIHELIGRSQAYFGLGRILETGFQIKFQKAKLTPEEKYLELLNKRPDLIQTFPLKYLAS